MVLSDTVARVGFAPSGTARLDSIRYVRVLAQSALYTALSTPVRIGVSEKTLKEDPREALIASVSPIHGESSVWQRGRQNRYRPGDLILVPTIYPFSRTVATIHESYGMFIRMSSLGRYRYLVERPRRPSGRDTPLALAAASFLRRFAIETAVAGAEVSADAELAVFDLISAALSELTLDDRYRLQDDRLYLLHAARDLIERRYRDPSFDPDALAAELHVSRRHLYRLFEGEETSPATILAEMRVAAARRLLVDDPWMPIGEVAAASGFASATTFRNRFKTRYGLSPTDYRERTRSAGSALDADDLLG